MGIFYHICPIRSIANSKVLHWQTGPENGKIPPVTDNAPVLPGLKMLQKLGEGGMSHVWKALDRRSKCNVAVKILKPELAANAEDARLFAAESKLMETIDHEGIVKSYGLYAFDGLIYYVMEFVDGYSFGQFLREKHRIQEVDCLLICESIASALDYAWNNFGIVHCDIKPDNIMINLDGTVKLTDLGLSRTFKFLKSGTLKAGDHVVGTPAYISPEQIYGDVELDCRADIYSLAASLYHLGTCRMLFPGDDSEMIVRCHCDLAAQAPDPRRFHHFSEGFCQLLEVMLVKDRDYRIPTWQDVFSMCRGVEAGTIYKRRPTMDIAPSSMTLDA